ncbi:MAG: hypothetical protein LH474_12730 [Chamaesiphon sp.]|nr:hypothetical protein [Chamaesiphon sp.]
MKLIQIVDRFSRLALTVAMAGMAIMPAIATAPMPPQLVLAKLNGQPVHVLYLTRSQDRVLVRCYPGQQPRLVVKDKVGITKEGTLSCGN